MSNPIRLTRDQVRAVDRIAIEKYHVPGIVLMENAARGAADVATQMLATLERPNVLVLCGGGNNGGDGLAIARHLHNRGADVFIQTLGDPARYTGDARINWDIVQTMNLSVLPAGLAVLDGHLIARSYEVLIVDALYGTGLQGPPRPPFDEYANYLNGHHSLKLPTLAVDLPSGLDCDAGRPFSTCIRATRTVTFVAEKSGFANPASRHYTGDITVADIGCPREIIDEVLRLP